MNGARRLTCHDLVPELDRRVLEIAAIGPARVVDEDVDAAVPLDRLRAIARGKSSTSARSPAIADRVAARGRQPRRDARAPRRPSSPWTTTRAPSAAKCSAMPRPIPEVDPVISAILPSSEGIAAGVSRRRHQHRLDDAAIVHRVERLAPAVERRRAGRRSPPGSVTPAIEQVNHALPHRELWLNDPCRRTLPQHQRVDVDRDARPATSRP